MKEFIKNDDAVSVVVGSILVLAILVTFMSVVTSTWVPIYEGNAEADHSDELFDTFVDLSKQIENAEEYPKSTTIKLGTDEMPFISNTNSVGHMEVNENGGILTLTTEIQRALPGFGEGDSFSVNDLNISQDAPITDFRINFVLDNTTTTIGSSDKFVLPSGFALILQSDTSDRLKISIEEVGTYSIGDTHGNGWQWNSGEYSGLRIRCEYTDVSGNVERWENTWSVITDIESGAGGTGVNGIIWNGDGIYTYLTIDLLNPVSTLTLEHADSFPVTINGSDYYTNNATSLYDLFQYYLKQPGETYDFYYTTYDKIVDCNLILLYNTTTDTIGGTTPTMDNVIIGSGTLTLSSDYNYFTDQSYIYDSGAIILLQNDGAVFKVGEAPISVSSDQDNNLILNLRTVDLQGDYETSGNKIEMIRTCLEDTYTIRGFTNNVTLTKNARPELKGIWDSYFEGINSTINLNTTASSTYYPDNMTLYVWNNNPNILLSVEQKDITVS